MIIDIAMLRMCRERSEYLKVAAALDTYAVEPKTRLLLDAIGRYFKTHDHTSIDFQAFIPWFERSFMHNMGDEDKTVYLNIIKNIARDYPDETTRRNIMESIYELNAAHTVQNTLERYANGDEVSLIDDMREVVDRYDRHISAQRVPFVDEDIGAFIDGMENGGGLKWRLACLNKYMRPLHAGDQLIVGARPDQGKTSFMASEATFMAPQLPPDAPIVWFCNEGEPKSIQLRAYTSALNCSFDELMEKRKAGTLYTEYTEAMGGERKLRIVPAHDFSTGMIENMVRSIRPGLVIYDMLDNVRGFSRSDRVDLQLEQLYQWSRNLGIRYGHPVIATSQISQEGANMQFPPQSALKDSKTGKQGACDAILMIGSLESEAGWASTRWLSLPKNKLRKPSSPAMMRETVGINIKTGRYNDLTAEEQAKLKAPPPSTNTQSTGASGQTESSPPPPPQESTPETDG